MIRTGDLCKLAIDLVYSRTEFYRAGGFMDIEKANAIAYTSISLSKRFVNALSDCSVASATFLRSCFESYYYERSESQFIVNKYYSDCEGEVIKEIIIMINYVLNDNKIKKL